MVHKLFLAATLVLAALVLVPAAPGVAPAPIVGTWVRTDGLVYRFETLADGGYARYAMSSHSTTKNKCAVKPNTLVYRYHPAGASVFRVDAYQWDSSCKGSWANDVERIKILATATKLTLSCVNDYAHVCWTYHRTAAAAAPTKLGLWRGENGRLYKWTALPGGAFAESLVATRHSSEGCLLKAGTVVYRYRAVAGGHWRVETYWWTKKCKFQWDLNDETIAITVTAKTMTESCDKQWKKVCFRYTRVK